jgi:hypothetical protein
MNVASKSALKRGVVARVDAGLSAVALRALARRAAARRTFTTIASGVVARRHQSSGSSASSPLSQSRASMNTSSLYRV